MVSFRIWKHTHLVLYLKRSPAVALIRPRGNHSPFNGVVEEIFRGDGRCWCWLVKRDQPSSPRLPVLTRVLLFAWGDVDAINSSQNQRASYQDWFTAWPGDALVAVAEMFLASVEFDSDDTRRSIVESCQRFHEDTRVLSAEFLSKLKRQNYVTPTRYRVQDQTLGGGIEPGDTPLPP